MRITQPEWFCKGFLAERKIFFLLHFSLCSAIIVPKMNMAVWPVNPDVEWSEMLREWVTVMPPQR